jgi:putative ABC transport system permease protein
MRVLHTFPSAIAALRANKGRSLLTALGIIIGVASVIAMLALAQSASAGMQAQLAGLGANVLTISPGSSQTTGARSGTGGVNTLKSNDVDAIVQLVSGVSAASPVVAGNAQVIVGSQNWATRVLAVAPAYQQPT